MKFTVLKWFSNYCLLLLAKVIEISFRLCLFLLPLGVYLILLQFRKNTSKISSLSAFTSEKSTWQHVFPGFMVVAEDPEMFKTIIKSKNKKFQEFLEKNKYLITFLFMCLIVTLMVLY